jgi:endonuclease/exonuclease/phosphatase (EEP) superfamily protein YafD
MGFALRLPQHAFPDRKAEDGARRKTAALILGWIGALHPDSPVILTADFNSEAGSRICEMLTPTLRDAWESAGRRSGPYATFNGFGKTTNGRRVYWILYRGPWTVREAEAVARSRNGVYLSDHYPIMAVFETPGLPHHVGS